MQQAFFTDPEDQSAYIYHRWLLNESVDYCKQAKGSQRQDASKQVSKSSTEQDEFLGCDMTGLYSISQIQGLLIDTKECLIYMS